MPDELFWICEKVNKSLAPFILETKKNGFGFVFSLFFPGFDVNKFVIKEIKNILRERKGFSFGRFAGGMSVYYRGGIIIELSGLAHFLVQKIIICNSKIIEIFNDILLQICKKYFSDEDYIPKKIEKIFTKLSETNFFAPEDSEEKTLFDLVLVLVRNDFDISGNYVPEWLKEAAESIDKKHFAKDCVEFFTKMLLEALDSLGRNIYLDYKIAFESPLLRAILRRKTNNGRAVEIFSLFGIDFKRIIAKIAKDYMTESFLEGLGNLIMDMVSTSAGGDDRVKTKSNPFNLTMTFGKTPGSRNFRWFGNANEIKGKGFAEPGEIFEVSDNKSFFYSKKIKPDVCVVVLSRPTLINFGVIAKFSLENKLKYSVTAENLEPGKTYYYRIFSPERKYVGDFYIPPEGVGFKFLAFSDSQGMTEDDYDLFLRMVCHAVKTFGCEFIAHMGDFVDDGYNENYWDLMLDDEIWGKYVVIPMSGNHEAKFNPRLVFAGVKNSVFNHFFVDFPKNQYSGRGAYYSFEYKGVLFLVLDTNASEGGLGNDQIGWAGRILKNSKAKWKIILLHKSVHSNGPHADDKEVLRITSEIFKIAALFGVDLVVGGHDHIYSRSPSRLMGEKTENGNGTVFITLGAAGAKSYKVNEKLKYKNEKVMSFDCPSFAEIEVSEDKISVKIHKFNKIFNKTSIADEFEIRKYIFEVNPEDVGKLIENLPDYPFISWKSRVEFVKKVYDSLDAIGKKKIENTEKFARAIRHEKAIEEIEAGDISIVYDKKTFFEAINEKNVHTIILECDEIKFENILGVRRKINITKNLLIKGCAKLCLANFFIKNGKLLLIRGDVFIDNNRCVTSVMPVSAAFRVESGSSLALGRDVRISYSGGFSFGESVETEGRNAFVYKEV